MYCTMAEPVRLQIRCTEDTATKVRATAKDNGMTLGEFVSNAADFIESNDTQFDRFTSVDKRT